MIGALAVAGQLDYRSTYNAYERLNDETRANFSFESFTRLKQEERISSSKGRSVSHCFSINSSKSNERSARTKPRRRSG